MPRPMSVRIRVLGVKTYELVFLALIVFLVLISIWRCYYLPVTQRDAIVGFDLVAKYAAEQGTIRSTVFSDPHLQGHLSNQPYYAPFTAIMQIIFRLTGLQFGKVWLSVIFIAFLVFLYKRLAVFSHPILAGMLTVVFLSIPVMYAYTFTVQSDYSNAVFFAVSVILFHDYVRLGHRKLALLSAGFMGFACWTRSETIIFVPFGALAAYGFARRYGAKEGVRVAILFVLIPALFFSLWHVLYYTLYFKQTPGTQIILAGISPSRAISMVARLWVLFGNTSAYGYIFPIFALSLLVNLTLFRDRRGLDLLIWLGILCLGFVMILLLVPAASIENTIKRGFFKLFPIMVFYLAQSRLYQFVSGKLSMWERDEIQGSLPTEPPLAARPGTDACEK